MQVGIRTLFFKIPDLVPDKEWMEKNEKWENLATIRFTLLGFSERPVRKHRMFSLSPPHSVAAELVTTCTRICMKDGTVHVCLNDESGRAIYIHRGTRDSVEECEGLWFFYRITMGDEWKLLVELESE